MKSIKPIIIATLLALPGIAMAQLPGLTEQTKNYISTGMPILLIAPDAISAGMGDAGAASTPDIYSAHWNNAKYAFIDGDIGVGTTYTPWLRNLKVSDMNLLYLGGFKRINSRSAVGASLTYFSLGEIQGTDADGNTRGTMNPNEFAVDVTYAMKLNNQLSLGATGRFVNSDLTNGQQISDGSGYVTTKPATSIAADLGLYWQSPIDKSQEIAFGAFISNLGAKLSYSDDDTKKEFLPANLRIGGRYTNHINESNDISLLFDINKLLVPTPPVTVGDSTYSKYYRNMTEYYNTGVVRGAIQSFYDAPGGFSEELRELQFSVGGEYWYKQTLAARAGYFFEHATKGGRQYLTFGFGLKYNIVQFDVAYLVPTTSFSSNPLSNTIRISLIFNFKSKQNNPTI
ncbi:MAG: type IX secretion system outer membrane channel protein PorV [Bacteroidales bacterium]|nr:type IX secretion system outer membrane channel protein PorV [Bacteroidales bacterium]